MSVPTDPRNHKPPERIAVKRLVFGDHIVEFSNRHGTSVKVAATQNYGPTICGATNALADEFRWLAIGLLPQTRKRSPRVERLGTL